MIGRRIFKSNNNLEVFVEIRLSDDAFISVGSTEAEYFERILLQRRKRIRIAQPTDMVWVIVVK